MNIYTDIEYKNKIKEIQPISIVLITNFDPKHARIVASKMSGIDAYILGVHIGTLLQIDYQKTFIECKTSIFLKDIRKKIDELDIKEFITLEDIQEKIKKLEPVAMKLIMNIHPKKVREFASRLDPIDAYILGQHIGGLLEIGYHRTEQDNRKVKIF